MSRHLSPADQAAWRAALLARRAGIEAQRQGHLAGQSRAEHAHEVLLQDGDDAPQRDADREIDLAMGDRDVVALADIDAALQRLDDGSYGRCGECGAEIPPARLQAAPTALRCVACESRQERGQPRPARL